MPSPHGDALFRSGQDGGTAGACRGGSVPSSEMWVRCGGICVDGSWFSTNFSSRGNTPSWAAIDPKRTVMQGAAYVGSSTWRADSCRSLQVKSRDSLCENYLHLVERQ